MSTFMSNLRTRAVELGITHAEVARRAGLSERRYGNYVTGRSEPDLATLVRIAQALATTPDRLLAFQRFTPAPENDARQRIVAAIEHLGPADLETLAVMTEALARNAGR